MAKILFIGDPHLRINDFEQSVALLRWIESVVVEHRPDVVCNLGDTFHNHAVLRSEIMKEFNDHINNIVSNDVTYWYVLGNHDQYKPKDNKYHALQSFYQHERFVVFDKPRTDILDITIVPYVQNFADFPLDTNKICITHNTFIGADYGFRREDCGIDADKVSADIIISGHIHKRQTFGKVVYPGTPTAHNATDVDEVKGLLLFDTETFGQLFIQAPFPAWRSIELELGQQLSIEDLHKSLQSTLDNTNKWILKLTGPKFELTSYLKSKKYTDLISDKNVIVKSNLIDAEKQNRVKIEASSPSKIVSEYVDKVYSGSLDKQLIIRKAQEIINNLG
jgi:DNA repair exonuclease SbcCD nuclease subunit